jgi:hypothetical protein
MTPTTRWTIHAPLVDNYGAPMPDGATAYGVFARWLIQSVFPGATSAPATGYWQGQREPVEVYTVDGATEDEVYRVAGALARYADQTAVYVTRTDERGFASALIDRNGRELAPELAR